MKSLLLFCIALGMVIPLPTRAAVRVPIIVPVHVPAKVPPALVGNFDSVHKFGVISLVGSNVWLRNQNSIFNHSELTKDVSDWRIAEIAVEVVQRYLGAAYEVKNISNEKMVKVSRAEFAHENRESPQESSGLYRQQLGGLPDQQVDAFIVWRPMSAEAIPGLWLTRGISGKSFLTVGGHIDVVDAHTFAVLGSSIVRARLKSGGDVFPTVRLEKEINFSDPIDLSSQDMAEYQAMFTQLLKGVLPVTLRRLGLGPLKTSATGQANPQ